MGEKVDKQTKFFPGGKGFCIKGLIRPKKALQMLIEEKKKEYYFIIMDDAILPTTTQKCHRFFRRCQNYCFYYYFPILFCLILVFGANAEPLQIDVCRPRPDAQPDIGQLRDDVPMRNALRPTAHQRWTKYRTARGDGGKHEIPYIITGAYSQLEQKVIRKAMHAIAKNTCVAFRKRAKRHANYVDIRNQPGQGCYTMVGMVAGNNVLMLESSAVQTCITPQTVVHELLHKVGLWHEQMRYDRDNYIKVHYENIPKNLYMQFHKVPRSMSTTYGVRYDYRSVMHYAKDAFAASPGRTTMQTKAAKFQNVIGTARHASRGDWTKVCAMYGCKRCMGKPFERKRAAKGDATPISAR